MADEWARVPSYASALERVLGPGSAMAMVEQLAVHAEELRAQGRRMFKGWFELCASVEP